MKRTWAAVMLLRNTCAICREARDKGRSVEQVGLNSMVRWGLGREPEDTARTELVNWSGRRGGPGRIEESRAWRYV